MALHSLFAGEGDDVLAVVSVFIDPEPFWGVVFILLSGAAQDI